VPHILRGLKAAGDYRLWLPFVGDQLLSLILNLAFELARDDRISDPEILSQILR
jgi:hypothetical protein